VVDPVAVAKQVHHHLVAPKERWRVFLIDQALGALLSISDENATGFLWCRPSCVTRRARTGVPVSGLVWANPSTEAAQRYKDTDNFLSR
jgi:hypothetical protein